MLRCRPSKHLLATAIRRSMTKLSVATLVAALAVPILSCFHLFKAVATAIASAQLGEVALAEDTSLMAEVQALRAEIRERQASLEETCRMPSWSCCLFLFLQFIVSGATCRDLGAAGCPAAADQRLGDPNGVQHPGGSPNEGLLHSAHLPLCRWPPCKPRITAWAVPWTLPGCASAVLLSCSCMLASQCWRLAAAV